MPERARPIWKRRSVYAWMGVWVVLSALGTVFHWAGWIVPYHDPAAETMLGGTAWRPVGNVFAVFAAPGWLVATRIAGRLMGHSVPVATFANAFSWGVWLLFLWIALEARRALARPSVTSEATTAAGGLSARGQSRRALVVNGVFGGGAALTAGGLVVGTAITPWRITVARYRVPIRGLPRGLDGLRVVQVSDTHLGPRIPASFIASAVEAAKGLKPDVVVLTGDYIHNGVTQIAPAAAGLEPLCRLGVPVIGTLGNHDWYADGARMGAALTAIGVRMVDDGRVFLDAATRTLRERGEPGSSLCFAGLSDLWTRNPDPAAALDGVDPVIPRVLLSHHPDTAELKELAAATGRRVDLMLSGHTHGGQVVVPLLGRPIVPSNFRQKYAYGLVQGPAFPVIVSAGVGMSLIPIRLGVPPEVVLVELVCGEGA
ncbi:MAG: metallophosphoesterase [Phycisphaerales bacterium]